MNNDLPTLLRVAWTAKGDDLSILEGDEAWSGRRLLDKADAIRRNLRSAGLAAAEPVAVYVGNEAVDFAAFQGVWEAGGVVVPVHRTSPPAAVAPVLAATGARFHMDGRSGEPELTGAAAPARDPLLNAAAVVMFTSGSTGHPKGVVLSHAALARKIANNQSLFRLDSADRVLLVLQITFSFGLWVSLLTLTRQVRLVIKPRFDVAEVLESLAVGRITRTALVPTMLRALVARSDLAGAVAAVRAGGHLRQIFTGGEIYGATLAAAMQNLLPQTEVINIFGLTETCTSDFVLLPADARRHPGAIGRPAPGIEYRVVGDGGKTVPTGSVGELQIQSATMMNGYLGQPEATRAAFADGYFRTGDLARLVADGVLEVVGRSKELISRGGNKVYPQEIEQILQSHPTVGQALATGVPDDLLGERIHVAVVPAPGQRVSAVDLRRWAAAHLDRFKLPDAIHPVAELPLGRTGKADRGELRRRLMAEGSDLTRSG